MDLSSALLSLAGGALIGLAAVLLLALNGRLAGISGILGGAFFEAARERAWRLAFLGGMAAGALVALGAVSGAFDSTLDRSVAALALSGLLVGLGTRLGGGCTSGHGVCGIGRLSKRSIAATVTFMAAGAATVLVVERAFGGVL